MAKRLFREKSLETISSPDQLKEYVAVSRPGIWLILIAITVMLAGFLVWAIVGRLDTRISVASVVEDGVITSYITLKDIQSVDAGMPLVTEKDSTMITTLSREAVKVDETIPALACYIGDFKVGDWVYISTALTGLPDGTYNSYIVVDSVPPISYVISHD